MGFTYPRRTVALRDTREVCTAARYPSAGPLDVGDTDRDGPNARRTGSDGGRADVVVTSPMAAQLLPDDAAAAGGLPIAAAGPSD